jgi:hypothetical protein
VDRLWAIWQAENPNELLGALALDFVLDLFGLSYNNEPPYVAGDVLSIGNGRTLCYAYSDSVTIQNLPGLPARWIFAKRSVSEYKQLQCPIPLSTEMTQQMRLSDADVRGIRARERDVCEFVGYLNGLPNYKSPACVIASIHTDERQWISRGKQQAADQHAYYRSLVDQFNHLRSN